MRLLRDRVGNRSEPHQEYSSTNNHLSKAAAFIFLLLLPSVNSLAAAESVGTSTSATSTLPPCNKMVEGVLKVNASCMVVVQAEKINSSGLLTGKGKDEEYLISIPDNQTWKDASHAFTPPCGGDGTFLMNLFSFLKKERNSKWFSLITEIKKENKKYDLCQGAYLRPTIGGELFFYANDAWGFYWNNSGEIQVEVHRIK